MRLGMMQPYFFPYAGYFSLIHATDQWVVFDSAQYMRRAWVNRNRIQCEGKEPWSYIRVPVEHAPRNTPISQIRIDQTQPWTDQLQGQLDVYRLRRAPFFSTVSDWLATALDSAVTKSSGQLSTLLIHLLESTCRYIGLPFHFQVFSQMQLPLPTEMSPGDWALKVSRSLKASTYINAPGGRDLFDARAFSAAGIQLQILEPQLNPYPQSTSSFLPALSILDLMMWNSAEEVRRLISQYSLISLAEPSASPSVNLRGFPNPPRQ